MNTIEKAIKYLSEPDSIRKVLNDSLRTADLERPNIAVGAKTVKYQHIEFGSYELGDYSREDGYEANDINLTWKTLELTQDKGNKLTLDKMDDEEAMANGIVLLGNKYHDKVVHPSMDKYRLSKIASLGHSFVINATFTAENIMTNLLQGKARLEDMKIDTSALLLYITAEAKALLKEAALKKGYWSVGNWNGNMDAEVEMFDKCKVVPVPANYFGNAQVQAILLHADAAPAFVKYEETEYFDKVPGHGKRKAEVDIGIYHDAFVYDELNRAVCLFIKASTATKTVTYAGDGGEGTAPTQAATVPGNSFELKANTFTKAGYKFVGWTDGCNIYQASDTYYMPNGNVVLTARWMKE